MEPLVFEPYLRPMVWGGRRLGELFGKRLPGEGTFGESWEISVHSHHVSQVADGPHRGTPLTALCTRRPRDLFGSEDPPDGQFPLLIKLLDCNELLSIQVHPTDELAGRLCGERFGKTEAWVVLDVLPGGRIYAGLHAGVTRSDLLHHLEAGTLERCLHAFTPAPGDCINLPAGTVHAVGGGVMLAEVQQSSDATLRLYDWNRVGADGKPRTLHIRESLEAINWNTGPVAPVAAEPISGLPEGVWGERLIRNPYFLLARYHVGGTFPVPTRDRLSIWLVIDGAAELSDESGRYRQLFRRGETVLVPACAEPLTWTPQDPVRGTVLLAAERP